ncbi:ABC transporter permease subunit [bacterium]|nr:ABC transporter permease subunit [bacterium]
MVPTSMSLGPLAYVGGFVVSGGLAFGALRMALPPPGTTSAINRSRWLQLFALLAAVALVVLALYFLSDFLDTLGALLAPLLGPFFFLGEFVSEIGQIFRLILVPVCGLIGGGVLWSVMSSAGQWIVERVSPETGKMVNFVLAATAGAVLFGLIALGLAWIYQLTNTTAVLLWPALAGALAGLAVAARVRYNASLPIGLTIYGVSRTVLNALRSVEALIMVIVFAVWVGIGPFAGVLALGLHTVAALAKLYSEQVEGISNGPIEAVMATGANRLQMIVYAVIPQIIPPYISFTMYRWDINVRMSTIIGFAGGGGIGFLLQQNINLLNYRAASAQIIAIAIVVSLMDYLSSALRQRTL